MKPEQPHQFRLLRQRRYAPFFFTTFLGSMNDNLLKFSATLLLTYQLAVPWLPPTLVGPLLGAIFIAPSLLLSATLGQWADRCDLAWLIRLGKGLEVLMMALAAWALWQRDVPLILACVLLAGVHVSLFSTVRYAYIPQHLGPHELTGGNGVLEMGIFLAILMGTLAGGVLISPDVGGTWVVGLAIVAMALLGRLASHWVPSTPAVAPGLKIHWNPVAETWRNLRRCHEDRLMFASMLGISWMWFFGAGFLAMFPALSKEVLHGQEGVAAFLLVLTSLGIGGGALMCEGLSRGKVELGLVPLGALGMAVFAVEMSLAVQALEQANALVDRPPWTAAQFVTNPAHWRFLADLLLMALSVGLFSVSLYAQMQARAEPSHRARIIATNNILNALFILLSAVMVGGLSAVGLSMGQLFGALAVVHTVACSLAFAWQPIFVRHALYWVRHRLGSQSQA
ncbi:MFS transporter [Aquabacterium sp.]|uniref:MFS transporter n=1 Tax=Aquabacterium sp. TaxID=1872578 RepID=UPI003D6D80F7